ncbi:uncharacterized protein EAF01_003329 [Botrytis porri]|uniref:uncharacterized protein n=1 Tax=Botrytis porri TaxID=87229 RepID=UPI001901B0A6|nr:uncharacterized protein EAF01_003329 [Botrytis porri]KAF7909611.1 hypothetical protein EAF01_003329 [Botrytis porri]
MTVSRPTMNWPDIDSPTALQLKLSKGTCLVRMVHLRLFSPQYVSEKLYGEQNEDASSSLVGEHPNKAQKRLGPNSERRSLEESLKSLHAFKML